MPDTTSAVNVTPGDEGSVGVFTTAQSVVTFPVASSLVILIWKVLASVIDKPWIKNEAIALALALIIGMLIYAMSIVKGESMRDKIIGFVIAIFNSFTLAATALGINTAISN